MNLPTINATKIVQQNQQRFAEIARRIDAKKAELAVKQKQSPNKPA